MHDFLHTLAKAQAWCMPAQHDQWTITMQSLVSLAGALVANTQLLRALLASPSSPAVQQRLSAWLLLWLEALATSPLAAAGTALKQDLPVLLSALLGDQQAGGSGRAAAGMRNVAAAFGGAGGLQVEQWLPLLAAAAAQADEVEAAAVGLEGSQQQQQQEQEDSEDEAADTGGACAWYTVYTSDLCGAADANWVALSNYRAPRGVATSEFQATEFCKCSSHTGARVGC
jgi:hypothetical protein